LLGGLGCSGSIVLFGFGANGLSYGVQNLAGRRHDAEEGKRTAVNHGPAANEDFEFAITAVDHVYFCSEFAPDAGRHTDGVDA